MTRLYTFNNMYLSPIQHGIQSAHVVSELFVKYDSGAHISGKFYDDDERLLWEWAEAHKTMILLNAGYSEEIYNLIDFFKDSENNFPWSQFHEGKDALDGALTCIGIILPEYIYNAAQAVRSRKITISQLEYLHKLASLNDPHPSNTQCKFEVINANLDTNGSLYTPFNCKLIDRLTQYGLV